MFDFLHAFFLSGGHVGHRLAVENPDFFSFNLFGSKNDEFWHFDLNQWTVNLDKHLVAAAVDLVGLRPVDPTIINGDFSTCELCEGLKFLSTANATAEREHANFFRFTTWWRMRNAKGAIHTVAVLERDILIENIIMAGFA